MHLVLWLEVVMLVEQDRLIDKGRVSHRRHIFWNFKIICAFFWRSSFSSVLNRFSPEKCSRLLESEAVSTGEIHSTVWRILLPSVQEELLCFWTLTLQIARSFRNFLSVFLGGCTLHLVWNRN